MIEEKYTLYETILIFRMTLYFELLPSEKKNAGNMLLGVKRSFSFSSINFAVIPDPLLETVNNDYSYYVLHSIVFI